MKKHLMLTFLLSVVFLSSNVQALSWAYPFVVWDGSVYEVKQNEPLDDQNIGKEIGAVETKPDNMTGDHYGNASNFYEIGTPYAEIQGVSPTAAIAVKDMDVWVRAVYVHKAPFHPMNLVTNPLFWGSLVFLAGITFLILQRHHFSKKN